MYNIITMYWKRITNNRIQQILPYRVFPLFQNTQKRASIPTKNHIQYGFLMENRVELKKNNDKKPNTCAK